MAPAAHAVNYQDLWWNPSESGWGLQLVQQSDQLFGTWFVYGTNRQPLWFTWISDPPGTNPAVRTGKLYGVTGAFFGALPFMVDPAREAGTATFTFSDARTATLVYTYDGTTVTKSITRQTFRNINIGGVYQGGIYRSGTGCSNSANNGTRLGEPVTISVTHETSSGAVTILEAGGTLCRFTGTFTQYGSSFEAAGSYTCQGETGNWTGREGTSSETTFGLKLAIRPAGEVCTLAGVIGGFKTP
jgi:hypothetical protein